MIDEVSERAADHDNFALLALGLLSASVELERLVSPPLAGSVRPAGIVAGQRGAEEAADTTAEKADDPCLLALLGALGFARRLREVLALVEGEPHPVSEPALGEAPHEPARGSLLR